MWRRPLVYVVVYVSSLAVCLTTIYLVFDGWVARASFALAVVGVYGFTFQLVSSAFATLDSEFTDELTSPNLRRFLAGNFRAIGILFMICAVAVTAPGKRSRRPSGLRVPPLAFVTALVASVLLFGYMALHLLVVAPLAYLAYLPASNFLRVLGVASPDQPIMRELTTPEGATVLDAVTAFGRNPPAFRNTFAAGVGVFGNVALALW
jgi:hypothetical protein